MSEDLQGLLEKIQRDGVDQAKAKAERVIADAQAKAKEILADAKAKADAAAADAKRQAESYTSSSQRTIKQAADNTVIAVEKAVTALFEKILLKDASQAMDDAGQVAVLAAETVRHYLAENAKIEVATSKKLLDAIRATLAGEIAKGGVDVILDESTGTGFRVLLANGRVEHNFTGTAVAESLAQQLRPSLAALLK